MKTKLTLALAAALLLGACAHHAHRNTRVVAVVYDGCYDWWPYVYYGPYDCWDTVWYGPAYYYYPYRTYSYPGAPPRSAGVQTEVRAPGTRARVRTSVPLPDRDDSPLSAPSLPRTELPRIP